MSGWRVWFAFEVKPGVTNTSMQDRSDHWRGLAESCRNVDGKIDATEYNHWLEIIVEYSHLWGEA
jgi:hypothetical protein